MLKQTIYGVHLRMGFCRIVKTEIGIVEDPVEKVFLEEITSAVKKKKLGKPYGLSKVSAEIINANGKVENDVMMKIYPRVHDEKGRPED